MDCRFTEAQLLLRDSVRKLMAKHCPPEFMRRIDHDKAYPYALYDAWAEAGLIALPFAETYGGLGGGAVDSCIIMEEIARVSADLSMMIGGSIFCGLNIQRKGSEEQKRHWLPKLVRGEIKMSISMSEPDAGSDVGAMRTSAARDGDHYVINGQKLWATGAGAKGNVVNMYVRTDAKAHHRQALSLFLIDNDTPGLELRKLDMLGRYCTGTYEIFLHDVRVPADRLVGGENQGWDCILSGLQAERVVAAAADCGSALGCVEMALAYAKERKQFGRPIGTFQAIAHMLADMFTEVEAARALTYRCASMLDHGEGALREIAMAKLKASEVYASVANQGMQIFGGYGYNKEFDMERHYRDARVATVAAGSSQMQRNLIANLLGLKAQ
ncbi:MAG TPA: acyl-CoA dehydrogenase family protein [Stellaceae bacterium]|jgi:alkylation response protein AidB-like acyl-CoA dehydrogenase|nr:acyl-CoA dehydrogenase family protein [Stellaceae bacterium]